MKLVRFPYLKETGIVNNRVTLQNLIKFENFPRAIEISAGSIAWRLGEVEQWLESRCRRSPGDGRMPVGAKASMAARAAKRASRKAALAIAAAE